MKKCKSATERYSRLHDMPIDAYWVEMGLGMDADIDSENGKVSDRFLKRVKEVDFFRNLSEKSGGDKE